MPGVPNHDLAVLRQPDTTTALATWTLASTEAVGAQHLLCRVKGAPQWGVPLLLAASATSHLLTGLDPSLDYEVKVETFDYAGGSNVATLGPAAAVVIPVTHQMIVGVNGATGWGPIYAENVIGAGIIAERITFQPETQLGENCTVPQHSKGFGFGHNTVVIGNVNDGTPLSAVLNAYVGNAVAQALNAQGAGNTDTLSLGNEMWLKGGVADAATYGRLYAAVKRALANAGVTLPLAFNAWGHGWFKDALQAAPELATLIDLLDGHYYGPASKGGDWGPANLPIHRMEASAAGIKNAEAMIVSECGCEYAGDRSASAPTEEGQAQAISSALAFFAQEGVRAAYVYTVHDDSTGKWGLVDSPWGPRPALGAVAAAAKASAVA